MSTERTGEPPAATGELDVHDPNPPSWAVMPAQDAVRRVLEPDTSMLRLRRPSSAPPVVRIEDRYLTGTLDLRAREFPYLLEFVRCRFEKAPDLRQATLAGLELRGCWLPGLSARNTRCDNDIGLINTTVRGGTVDLTDATIRGSLLLTGSRLSHPGRYALRADRLELAGALLGTSIDVAGEVRVPGMHSGGNINFSGATLHNPDGAAMDGNGMHVGGNLVCGTDIATGRRFTSVGWVFLPSVQVDSDLSMRGARLSPGGGSMANLPVDDPYYDVHTTLIADRIRVRGNADLDQEFTSTGTVRMVNAEIGGSLRMTRSRVDISAGAEAPFDNRAVYLDGIQILGNLDARGIRVTGEWRSLDLSVRGSVRFNGAVLANPGHDVLVGRRATIGGNFECRDAEIYGSMIMQEVQIGANLDLRASRLSRPGRYTRDRSVKPCLDIRAGRIGRDVICASGTRAFSSAGEIRMVRATVGRQLLFAGAELGVAEGGRSALNLFGGQTQELALSVARPPAGRVTLRQMRCVSLGDNEAFWQAVGGIDLESFRYESLNKGIELTDDAAVVQRLQWLRTAEGDVYRPGPYDQLAAMLRATGNEEHADTVLVEKQRRRYAALARGFRVLGPFVLVWSWLQRSMVGYGYRPARAFGWLALLLVVGTAWFAWYPTRCVPITVPGGDPATFAQYRFCPITNQDDHLVWNPFLFTLDLLIPIVDFGNKNGWAIGGVSQWFAAGLIAAGWTLATTVAAGVTRALRRQ
ncbi:MAG TPA: hypothetical protein VGD84_08100 [Pseudonocardiaceae bacterium]